MKKDKVIPADVNVFDELSGLVSVTASFSIPDRNQPSEPVALCLTFRDKAARDAAAPRIGAIATPVGPDEVCRRPSSCWQNTKFTR